MNKKELSNYIKSLALRFGETVKCEWLDMEGNEWIRTKMEINVHFLSEFEKGHIRNVSMTKKGVEFILFERERQISEEGWDAEHDDIANNNEQLARAAAVYALPEHIRDFETSIENSFPWDMKWYKPLPNDRIRELAKAGALIAAEIDRLQRLK